MFPSLEETIFSNSKNATFRQLIGKPCQYEVQDITNSSNKIMSHIITLRINFIQRNPIHTKQLIMDHIYTKGNIKKF